MGLPAIRIASATKHYGSLQALAGVDLEVAQGEFFGLLGPNGAGKTTLISALSGLVRVDRGTLEVMGHKRRVRYGTPAAISAWCRRNSSSTPFFSVRELLRIQSGYFGHPSQRRLDRRDFSRTSTSAPRLTRTCGCCRAG